MKFPRILLAAGASGSGKTLITCGLLQALVNRGKKTASFKCGPDYIDPMFHSRVIGAKSRNLDTFFTSAEVTRYLFARNAKGCDISVMEGVMGYYDGVGGITDRASAFDLADTTDTPVIFIVNSKGMSLSLIPYIKGFLKFKENSRIQGVIFNQMSPMLYPRMKKLVEAELPVKVLGYLPKVEDCIIESRHLGLVLPGELFKLREKLQKLAGIMEETLDIDEIVKLAEAAPELPAAEEAEEIFSYRTVEKVRIGVARDEAFCFLYEDNLSLLHDMGAELVFFSPLHDRRLPKNLDGLLLCGGYPELHAETLEKNEMIRSEIKKAVECGMPCMAECGGFLYLHETIEDMDGKPHQMCGIIQGTASYTGKLSKFGYVTLQQKTSVLGCSDFHDIPAHEFHYYDSTACGESFLAKKPESSRGWLCMHGKQRLLAGFPHFYYYGNLKLAEAFLTQCEAFRSENNNAI